MFYTHVGLGQAFKMWVDVKPIQSYSLSAKLSVIQAKNENVSCCLKVTLVSWFEMCCFSKESSPMNLQTATIHWC